jgi:hypothetical protein
MRLHHHLLRWRDSFVSHVATLVTITSAEVRKRIAATLESEEEWLFEKPASAPDLGSLGRSKD